MIAIKNLAEFKRALKFGTKVSTVHAIRGDMGVRTVSIVRTSEVSFRTERDGEFVNSWFQFGKAGDYEFNGTSEVKCFWGEGGK